MKLEAVALPGGAGGFFAHHLGPAYVAFARGAQKDFYGYVFGQRRGAIAEEPAGTDVFGGRQFLKGFSIAVSSADFQDDPHADTDMRSAFHVLGVNFGSHSPLIL